MRIEQRLEKSDTELIDSSTMDVEEAPPDETLKKASKLNESIDNPIIKSNGNLKNGITSVADVEMENASTQPTDLKNNRESTEPVENGIEGEAFIPKVDSELPKVDSELPKNEPTQDNHLENNVKQNDHDDVDLKMDAPDGDNEDKVENTDSIDKLRENKNPPQEETVETEKGDKSENSVDSGKNEKDNVPLVNGDEIQPRRSQRAPKGPTVESLVEAATAKGKKATVPKVDTTQTKKVSEPVKAAAKPSKVSRLRIDDRKVPEEMEHMRAMAKVVYGIGLDLAKQLVYKDLVRVQSKRESQGNLNKKEEDQLVKLRKRHEELCSNNKVFCSEARVQCPVPQCDLKTDSVHALEYHKEAPHRTYDDELRCSFCDFSTRTPLTFQYHMDMSHKRKCHDYIKMPNYQCNMCHHDALSKNALMKHKLKCEKKFNLKRNLNPYYDVCDIPIKKMFVPKPAAPTPSPPQPPRPLKPAASVAKKVEKQALLEKQKQRLLQRQKEEQIMSAGRIAAGMAQQQQHSVVTQQLMSTNPPAGMAPNMAYPQTYCIGGNMYTLVNNNGQYMLQAVPQPPRQTFPVTKMVGMQSQVRTPVPQTVVTVSPPRQPAPPVKPATKTPTAELEVCEICGGFVKDRESLRVHFYWAHKIDIRKDVFARKNPSLSCEQCPEKFWTFQGYDRHRKLAHKGGKQAPEPAKPSAVKKNVFEVQCPLCRSPAAHILNHLLSVHNISVTTALEKKQCTICLISFPTVQDVEEHLIHLHGFSFLQDMPKPQQQGKAAKAPMKAGGAPVPVGLYAHSKKVDPTCKVCNITFSRVQDYTNHCNRYHVFKCYRCGCRWNSYSLLVRHLSESHFNAQDECIVCHGKFTAGIPFIQHMLTSHIKGLSIRVKKLSSATLARYTRRDPKNHKATPIPVKMFTPKISPQKPVPSGEVEVIDVDSSVKKPTEAAAVQSPTKQPIILKIDDGEDETIEIHENAVDD